MIRRPKRQSPADSCRSRESFDLITFDNSCDTKRPALCCACTQPSVPQVGYVVLCFTACTGRSPAAASKTLVNILVTPLSLTQ
jgi:hypothetical protein